MEIFNYILVEKPPCYEPLYEREEIKFFDLVQHAKSNFTDFLEINGAKHKSNFDYNCQENCGWRNFDIRALGGKHHGWNRVEIEHNVIHKSKLGRDNDLQNTKLILFKLP